VEHLDSYGTDFCEILCWGYWLKFVDKVLVWLKSVKNNKLCM